MGARIAGFPLRLWDVELTAFFQAAYKFHRTREATSYGTTAMHILRRDNERFFAAEK